MKIAKHIGYRFLTDPRIPAEMTKNTLPSYDGSSAHPLHSKYLSLIILLSSQDNKNYVVTNSVFDKLNMLTVKRDKKTGFFDWTVFDNLKDRKHTFLYEHKQQGVVRMVISGKYMFFAVLTKQEEFENGQMKLNWVVFFVDRFTGAVSENWSQAQVQGVEETLYRLLCFVYLSDNEEVIVPAGTRYGTKKSGKVVNSLPFDVTVINSKWNTTSHSHAFDVNAHFALRWTGAGRGVPRMVFINAFTKGGIEKTAPSLTVK